jgi:poly [ADP-ribose] polymerase 6/8
LIGQQLFGLLKWTLLSFHAHLISIPKEMQFAQFTSPFQFMTLLASPEAEERFNGYKQQYGSQFLWHGSNADRWHSILRNGLKNASGTSMQAHGAAKGPGIYMADDSSMSWGYSQASSNRYQKSVLGSQLHVISLVEVAKVPELNHFPGMHTLTKEEACVVRFMFLSGSFAVNVTSQPPTGLPTLEKMLEFHAGREQRKDLR